MMGINFCLKKKRTKLKRDKKERMSAKGKTSSPMLCYVVKYGTLLPRGRTIFDNHSYSPLFDESGDSILFWFIVNIIIIIYGRAVPGYFLKFISQLL